MSGSPDDPLPLTRPTFAEGFRTYARIGCLSFGGPAGQIALMHREFVDDRRWIDEAPFSPRAQFPSSASRTRGAAACDLGRLASARLSRWACSRVAVHPGPSVMLGLSLLYVTAAGLDWFAVLLTLLAFVLLFRVRVGILSLLAICSVGGLLLGAGGPLLDFG